MVHTLEENERFLEAGASSLYPLASSLDGSEIVICVAIVNSIRNEIDSFKYPSGVKQNCIDGTLCRILNFNGAFRVFIVETRAVN